MKFPQGPGCMSNKEENLLSPKATSSIYTHAEDIIKNLKIDTSTNFNKWKFIVSQCHRCADLGYCK